MPAGASTSIRPLLKWAGGKRQLLPALRRHYPAVFDRYTEPFVGSGAVFFDLYATGRLSRFAIAVLGYAGAGKSTTAAGFVELGFPLLADDVTVLREQGGSFQVQPGYPRLNLWPDRRRGVVRQRGEAAARDAVRGINDWWDKRYVDLETEGKYCSTPLPLAAVYVLGERASGARAPRVEAMSVKDALSALTVGIYTNYAHDESMRATEFQTLGRLIRTTPVRWVTAHDSPAQPLDLCETILADYGELTSRPVVRS